MKIKIIILMITFIVFNYNYCKNEEKKDSSLALAVIGSFQDNFNGTVTDSSGKMWMKCAYGQVWSDITNTCTGTGGGTTYGAQSVAACDVEGFCYDSTTLTLNSGPAYNACKSVNLGGFTDWRLPTRYELAGLIQSLSNRETMLLVFPNSPDDKFFWTGSINEVDPKLAYSVNTASTDFGKEYTRNTTTVLYVRCVRP